MKTKITIAGTFSKFILLFVAFAFISAGVIAQTVNISGKVTDENDLGVPGATIQLKGTTIGTVTDYDGNYTISFDATEGMVMVFSFIGYDSREIEIGVDRVINVKLYQKTEELEEVVVVGFGQQKKATVVGSVVQVKGDELLKAGSVATVSEALSGILPGVSTMQATGMPGASAATILIRGQSSWNNNTPLFLVDGVERPFNDLDPNEIENISVLKDASATAVFGVKAANGVILITTKRGISGKTQLTYTGNWGVKQPVMETDFMTDFATALEYRNIAVMNEGSYASLTPASVIADWRDPNRDMDFYSYTNWIEEMIVGGPSQSHNLNMTGGNDFIKYFTSFGYNYDGDIFDVEPQEYFDPRTYQKRYNWRSNLDFSFTETTSLQIKFSGDFKNWHGNDVTGYDMEFLDQGTLGNFSGMFTNVQVGTPPVLSDGRLGVGNYASDWFTSNYLGEMEREGEMSRRSTRIFTDAIFEQEFLNDFIFRAKISYNFDRRYQSTIDQKPLYYISDYRSQTIEQFGINPEQVEGLPTFYPENLNKFGSNLYYQFSLDYNKTINGDHNISALALMSRRNVNWSIAGASQAAFPSYEESWVGRATYNYKYRYMVEFNGAYNGSEKFAPGLRFGFFPSVALGWTLSEENFFQDNISFIDFMKFRYSWGEIGSDFGAGRFTYLSDYGFRTAGSEGMFGWGVPYAQPEIIYFEGQPANLIATWETSRKQNLGLEMTFFKSRLKTFADFFDEKRSGILMKRRTIPVWYGNEAPDANIGETKNHGFEIETIWNDRIGSNWSYYIKGHIAISENRIVTRDDPKFTPEYQKQAGKPIGWNSGYLMDGYLNSWDDVYNYTQAISAVRIPGDFSYVDYNADGVLDNNDVVPILEPSYSAKTFAFSAGLTYKGISVTALFNGAIGLSKALSSSFLWEYSTHGGPDWRMLNTEMLNFWTPENPNPEHPALHTATNAYNGWSSTYSRRDADYLRFKSAEIKYTFSEKLLSRTKVIDGLEIYVNGNNLYTWSTLPSMFDPEAGKLEVYPITKRYMFGVRATF